MVGINEGGVAASVVQGARVDAGRQGDGVAAVGDDGQGGELNLREAVDNHRVVLLRGEGRRIEGDGVGPQRVVAGAVGVAVAEDDRAGAIGIEGGGAVHEDRGDVVAADVGDGVRGRSGDIHETRHGGTVVGGHVGDDAGQLDVEGEGPVVLMSGAVFIRIGVDDVALAAVEAGAVNGDGARRERLPAGTRDDGQDDAVGGYLRETGDGGLAASVGDGEVLGHDVEGVCPGVGGVVDGVGEGVDGVAASAVGDEG